MPLYAVISGTIIGPVLAVRPLRKKNFFSTKETHEIDIKTLRSSGSTTKKKKMYVLFYLLIPVQLLFV